MAQWMNAILMVLMCTQAQAQFFKGNEPSGTDVTKQFKELYPQFSNLHLESVTIIDGAEPSHSSTDKNLPVLFDRLHTRHLLADFDFGQMRFSYTKGGQLKFLEFQAKESLGAYKETRPVVTSSVPEFANLVRMYDSENYFVGERWDVTYYTRTFPTVFVGSIVFLLEKSKETGLISLSLVANENKTDHDVGRGHILDGTYSERSDFTSGETVVSHKTHYLFQRELRGSEKVEYAVVIQEKGQFILSLVENRSGQRITSMYPIQVDYRTHQFTVSKKPLPNSVRSLSKGFLRPVMKFCSQLAD